MCTLLSKVFVLVMCIFKFFLILQRQCPNQFCYELIYVFYKYQVLSMYKYNCKILINNKSLVVLHDDIINKWKQYFGELTKGNENNEERKKEEEEFARARQPQQRTNSK